MSDDTVPATHTDLPEAKGFAFVATTGPHQAPHVSPTWYLWDAAYRHLLISLTTGRQKYRNMRRDHTSRYASPTRGTLTATSRSVASPKASSRTPTTGSSTPSQRNTSAKTNTPHTCRAMCASSFESSHNASEALAEPANRLL